MSDIAREIASRELGAAPAAIEYIEHGWRKDTYRIETDSGPYILQLSADGNCQIEALRRCLNCYQLLGPTPVPVPRPVTDTVGSYGDRHYLLVECRPGTAAQLDVSLERARAGGKCLAQIHAVRSFENCGSLHVKNGEFAVKTISANSYRSYRHERGREVAIGLAEYGMEMAGNAVKSCLERHGSVIPETVEPVFCHGDFTPDNLLYEGSTVTGVVDFDEALSDAPIWELTRAATAFWLHDPGPESRLREACYAGYLAERPGHREVLDRVEPLYRVLTLARGVYGLLDSRGCDTGEKEFFRARILDTVNRADRRLTNVSPE